MQAATSCVRHHKKRKRALNGKRQRHWRLVSPGSTLDRQKKNPEQSILGAYSSLCLTLFCPGDFGGVGGTGVSRRKGLLALATCPTRQEPSVTAITIWSISEQSRLQIRAAVFPRPSLFGALLGGAQFGRGRECWEDLKKLLFIYVPQRAPAIALSRTVGSLFSVKSIGAGPAPKKRRTTRTEDCNGRLWKKSAKSFNSSQSR